MIAQSASGLVRRPSFARLASWSFVLWQCAVGVIAVSPAAFAQSAAQAELIQQLSPDDQAKALKALSSKGGEATSDAPVTASNVIAVPAPSATSRLEAKKERDKQTPHAGDGDGDGDSTFAKDGGLPLFGYSLFSGNNDLTPPSDVPTPGNYVLGPGDIVRVQMFGNQNDTLNLSVTRDGSVNFPKLGPIQVAGLAFEDAKAVIERRVEKEMIGVQTNITLGPLRGIQVFLLGNVSQPGAYTVSGLATITHALVAGGGVATVGSLRNIQLKRGGRLVQTLDLYDLLLRGNASADVRLQAGDAVFVPPVGARIAIAGAVRRPAIYEVKGAVPVRAALDMAGGLLPGARKDQAMLERIGPDGRRSLRQFDLGQASNQLQTLLDGDRLTVGNIATDANNRVRIFGHVRYPNTYAWSPDLTLGRLLAQAQLRPSEPGLEIYPLLGLLEKTDPLTGLRDWHGFDLGAVSSGAIDLPLGPEDRVIVLTRADIAYLSAPAVRAALRGVLPQAITEQAISRREISGAKVDLESTAEGMNAQEKVCPGLAELVKMADSARALSIRAQLETQASAAEARNNQAALAEQLDSSCPDVYHKAPSALPYLLEHGIGMAGEVRRPGLYPIADGTRFERLLASTGGETAQSDPSVVEFSNSASGATTFERQSRGNSFADAVVQPGGVYRFIPASMLPEVGSIDVRGEVRFPGRYVIARGEKLSQVLQRAGGLSENAYAYGAVFTRESARKAEMEANLRSARDLRESLASAATKGLFSNNALQGQTATSAVTELAQRLETAKPVGRIVIEADPSVLAARPAQDFLLEPGDSLYIPKRPNSVAVNGQVLNPGSLLFISGASPETYIEQAGGVTQAADDSRSIVVLPNGIARAVERHWLSYHQDAVPPGSVIVVPRDVSPYTGLLLTEKISSIVGSLAVSAAALVTISR